MAGPGGGLSSGSGVKSRMALHVLDTLVSDLLPNFSYNLHTSRFIRSPEVGRKVSRASFCCLHT